LEDNDPNNLKELIALAKASGTLVSWLSGQVFAFVGSATSAALNLVIAFFALYYMLRSGANLWGIIRGYIPFSSNTADALRDRFFNVTQATLLGTVLVATIQGGLSASGFGWCRFPSVVLGHGHGICLDPSGARQRARWLPAMLVLLVQARYGSAITMAVIGGVVASNIDNLIRPLVYRRVSNIHPMITLVGAFAGVKYFGLLGLLLGPLAIAYLFELLRFYREEYGTADEVPAPVVAPL
jgi:predicted PurR-regulated permease PerM